MLVWRKLSAAAAVGVLACAAGFSSSLKGQKAPVLPALMFTEAQAIKGQKLFEDKCTACHGVNMAGGPAGPSLIGAPFKAKWSASPAVDLFKVISETMPTGEPGSLSADDSANVMAYIVKTNGGMPGSAPLPTDAVKLTRLSFAAAMSPSEANNQNTAVTPPIMVSGGGSGISTARTRPPRVVRSPDAFANAVFARRAAMLDKVRPVTDQILRNPPVGDWVHWRRTYDAHGFSPLSQITRANVGKLVPAWTLQLAAGGGQVIPLVYDGVMYAVSNGRVEAIDAANGDRLWQYTRPGNPGNVRSLAIYDNLIFYAAKTSIVALDMRTGDVVWDRLIAPEDSGIRFSSGPLVVKGKVIGGIGYCTGPYPGGCFIVALDAKSGKELWRFHTLAKPNEPGGDTWYGAPAEQRYGGSAWIPGSYDPDLDLLYWGVAQTYKSELLIRDGIRAAGLYTNSTLALNPDTGKMVWYYQHLDGDVWDLDWAYERTLATLTVNGQKRRTVTTAGKMGLFDTLDAATGKYLFSTDSGYQTLVTAIDPLTGKKTIDPKFTPEANVGKLICPTNVGGRNWPSTSFNPVTNILYVPANNTCGTHTWYHDGANFDFHGAPEPLNEDAQIGRVQAIDLTAKKTLWVRNERAPHTSAILNTAGGLIFEGNRDRYFRASDDRTGEILWEIRLDMSPGSFPISFAVDGEQYIAITTGQIGAMENVIAPLAREISPPTGGTTLWVFKLPRDQQNKK